MKTRMARTPRLNRMERNTKMVLKMEMQRNKNRNKKKEKSTRCKTWTLAEQSSERRSRSDMKDVSRQTTKSLTWPKPISLRAGMKVGKRRQPMTNEKFTNEKCVLSRRNCHCTGNIIYPANPPKVFLSDQINTVLMQKNFCHVKQKNIFNKKTFGFWIINENWWTKENCVRSQDGWILLSSGSFVVNLWKKRKIVVNKF